MQIDALVDQMQDLGDLGPGAALPPPLPPKGTSKVTWIVGAIVVLLAAGLGIGAGWYLLADREQAPSVTSTARPAPPAPAEPAAAEPAPAEPAADVVQMDEVVFGAE